MIEIGEHAEGCILFVHVQPGARKEGIKGEHGPALKVAVTAPPDRGRANAALVDVLRHALNVKAWQIELLSGCTSRDKRFLIRGLTKSQLNAKIGQLMQEFTS